MEISVALQVALFLASLAIIVLVACVIPLAFQARRNSEELLRHVREMKASTQLPAQDGRELIRNLNDLCRLVCDHVPPLAPIGEFLQG